ncbi:MAG TPA: hypothetical protein DD473_02605 [Planctomycetaceae bacterium]|nr:hypothetical protein [Planctomycetaceae bacterium]|tara:strand:- start:1064 stop:1423 length:360 start_codon:yes stop_codon:yes gene_type:complete
MPFWKLVFYTAGGPFISEKEYLFGDCPILAVFEEDAGKHTYMNSIQIDIDPELPQQTLTELFATLAHMSSSDAYKNIDFDRGLLRGDKYSPKGCEFVWKTQGILRKDGTFNHDDPTPHK